MAQTWAVWEHPDTEHTEYQWASWDAPPVEPGEPQIWAVFESGVQSLGEKVWAVFVYPIGGIWARWEGVPLEETGEPAPVPPVPPVTPPGPPGPIIVPVIDPVTGDPVINPVTGEPVVVVVPVDPVTGDPIVTPVTPPSVTASEQRWAIWQSNVASVGFVAWASWRIWDLDEVWGLWRQAVADAPIVIPPGGTAPTTTPNEMYCALDTTGLRLIGSVRLQ